MIGVTHRQNTVLKFIERYAIENDGTPPSYDEIATAVGVKSKSQISRIIGCLEQRGLIARRGHGARSITVLASGVKLGFELPTDLLARLQRYCAAHGETAAAVVIDAVTLHMDEIEDHPKEGKLS